MRWRRRIISSTWPSSSMGNGGVSDSARCSASSTESSISPVARLGLTLPGSRLTTSPAADSTCSGRSRWASAWAPGAVSGWKTSCTTPERSRRSMKIKPPWSRRRCTQPATRTCSPSRAASSSPAQASRYGLARGGLTPPAPRAARSSVSNRSVSPSHTAPDVVHDGLGRDELVLPALAVAELDAFVAEDGNVAGAAARGLLELPLHAAPPELQPRAAAGAPDVGGHAQRGRLVPRLIGDVDVDRRLHRRRLVGGHEHPLHAGRPPHSGRVRAADLLGQVVVAPAAAERVLRRLQRAGLVLEQRPRVVVQPAHEGGVDGVGLARLLQQVLHLGEVLEVLAGQPVDQPRRVRHHPLGGLVLGVERAQRVEVDPGSNLLQELASVRAQVRLELLAVLRPRL